MKTETRMGFLRSRGLAAALLAAGLVMFAPAAAFAAGGDEGMDWTKFISSVVNFTIYVGGLAFLLRKPAAQFFASRRKEIAAEMEAAKEAHEAAARSLAETREKLATLDAERERLMKEFRELGEQERRQIVAAAEAEASRIVQDAETSAEVEARRAKAALEAKMVDLALELAEQALNEKLTSDVHGQLIERGMTALTADALGA